MSPRRLLLLLMAILIVGCVSAAGEPGAASRPIPAPPEFNAVEFVPSGDKLVRVVRGDVNGDGRDDAVVVTMPDDSDPEARFARRTLSIVVADPVGGFAVSSKNAVLAGCKVCGGSMGDGLADVAIKDGSLVVVNEGGVRARWSDRYTFRYDAGTRDWILVAYISRVSSQADQKSMLIESTAKDFGVKRFADLAQDDLPRATIP